MVVFFQDVQIAVTQATGTGGDAGASVFPTNHALADGIYRVSTVFFFSLNFERSSLFFTG